MKKPTPRRKKPKASKKATSSGPTILLFKQLPPQIKSLLNNSGLYAGGDSKFPEALVPLFSIGGKVYSMKIDYQLDPHRFLETATFNGPFSQNR